MRPTSLNVALFTIFVLPWYGQSAEWFPALNIQCSHHQSHCIHSSHSQIRHFSHRIIIFFDRDVCAVVFLFLVRTRQVDEFSVSSSRAHTQYSRLCWEQIYSQISGYTIPFEWIGCIRCNSVCHVACMFRIDCVYISVVSNRLSIHQSICLWLSDRELSVSLAFSICVFYSWNQFECHPYRLLSRWIDIFE